MRRHIVYALGLALALVGAGAWAIDSQNAGNGAGTGTELQNPAPANPAPAAPADQTAPNAAQPNPAAPNAGQPNPLPPDQAQPNPAPPSPEQTNPAPANPAPANPAPVNPAPPNPEQQNLTPPAEQPNAAPSNPPQSGVAGEPGTMAAPVYYSPLQEFVSHQVDEVGELSQELTQLKAAKRPEAVMVLYHMIRDHRLLADAAENMLARRGDVAAPTITPKPIAGTPEEMIRQNIQGHEQTASDLQQMVANANAPEEKRFYQRALDVTNQHLNWLHSLDQGQQVSLGFFGPTTALGDLTGATTVASAAGYPQPVIARTAGFQQQFAAPRSTRHRRIRRYRHGRSARYSRTHRYRRTSSYYR